jgi:hypothetical protein
MKMMAIRRSKKARRPKRKRITYFAYEPSAEKTNWSIEEMVTMEEKKSQIARGTRLSGPFLSTCMQCDSHTYPNGLQSFNVPFIASHNF